MKRTDSLRLLQNKKARHGNDKEKSDEFNDDDALLDENEDEDEDSDLIEKDLDEEAMDDADEMGDGEVEY